MKSELSMHRLIFHQFLDLNIIVPDKLELQYITMVINCAPREGCKESFLYVCKNSVQC